MPYLLLHPHSPTTRETNRQKKSFIIRPRPTSINIICKRKTRRKRKNMHARWEVKINVEDVMSQDTFGPSLTCRYQNVCAWVSSPASSTSYSSPSKSLSESSSSGSGCSAWHSHIAENMDSTARQTRTHKQNNITINKLTQNPALVILYWC